MEAIRLGTIAERRERPARERPRHAGAKALIDVEIPVPPQVGLADVAVRIGAGGGAGIPGDANADHASGEERGDSGVA